DFTTLATREANCREEVRLNRRLAPQIFLGTAPLSENVIGARANAQEGRPHHEIRSSELSAFCGYPRVKGGRFMSAAEFGKLLPVAGYDPAD
ncbi:hypothetical protein MJ956_08850, partial [Aurantimonas sp. LRZ36]|nr:hypothetical protein [Aurantimonas marianensis]